MEDEQNIKIDMSSQNEVLLIRNEKQTRQNDRLTSHSEIYVHI